MTGMYQLRAGGLGLGRLVMITKHVRIFPKPQGAHHETNDTAPSSDWQRLRQGR